MTPKITNAKNKSKVFDWQGHRGARGLVPENTIPSFIKALNCKVKTLELDVVVSKDNQLIISHEPWFSHHICSKPDGRPILEKEEQYLQIYNMNYEQIKFLDCGIRGNEKFPEQKPRKAYKPSLKDMVKEVENYSAQQKMAKPRYNIEIKSQPSHYDSLVPAPEKFVQLALNEIKLLGIRDRVNLQSFDFNVLREIKKQDPDISIAMLVENMDGVQANLDKLGFTPQIYSPYYLLLNETVINEIHEKGMRVIPWTVNDPADMKKLIAQGVDGIITDYPNRIIPR